MELMRLGHSGPQVAAVGVGCWAWGDRLYWDYGQSYDQEDLRAAFRASRAAGLTFFDTAEVYGLGNSERLLGAFAAEASAEVAIASKFFPLPWRLSRGQLLAALRHSLKRLGVPQIQLYQMHWPFPPVSIERWMDAMADAVEAGLIKQVGVSNYSPHQTERAHRALQRRGLHLASNQVRYSLLDHRPERSGLLQLCKDLEVTVIAYGPIAQGLLTGKYSAQNPPPPRRRVSNGTLESLQPLLNEMRRIGSALGDKTPAQVAINWCMAKSTLPIPGAKNARQATENAGALGWSLSVEDMARLDEMSAEL